MPYFDVATVLVYGVISSDTEKVVETFVRREDAERFLRTSSATTQS
jgi:hypothetical protein